MNLITTPLLFYRKEPCASLPESLTVYRAACFTGLWIESHEHEDALRGIAGLCREQNRRLAAWNVEQGLRIPGADSPADLCGADRPAAIRSLGALANPESFARLVLENFHHFTQLADVAQALGKVRLCGDSLPCSG